MTGVFTRGGNQDTHTHREDHMRTLGEDGHLQAKGRCLEETNPDHRLQDSRTVKKYISVKLSSLWYFVLTALGNESVWFSCSVVSDSL